jgi:hypothetical protein
MKRAILAVLLSALAAACGSGSTKKAQENPPKTTVDLATHQAAAVALGQADLVSSADAGCVAGAYRFPGGDPFWDGARLFVSDGQNRIHVYQGLPAASGAAPAISLGQTADCVADVTPTASGMGNPLGLGETADGAKLLVSDSFNARVLVYSPIPAAAGGAAAVAVGQPDLVSNAAGCTAATMAYPSTALVAGGRLVVVDMWNHRVLVWAAVPSSSGAAADLVVGQPDLTTCTANTGGASASTLDTPTSAWSDGTRLAIVDSNNHRVLLWTTFPTANGQAADAVLGQTDFANIGPDLAPTASGLAWPTAVTSDGTHLFVADGWNNRVLGYAAFPSAPPGPAATMVLGQADLVHGDVNEGGSVSGASLATPHGLAVVGRDLVVADYGNHRVLVYRSPP